MTNSQVYGDASRSNAAIWMHGMLSSRYEAVAVDQGLLEELDMYIVSFDRPGYGQSDAHPGRDFNSSVSDLLAVADELGLRRFFVIGVSGGGSYALAAAAFAPERVRGVLLFSAAGPVGVGTNPVVREVTHYILSLCRPMCGNVLYLMSPQGQCQRATRQS